MDPQPTRGDVPRLQCQALATYIDDELASVSKEVTRVNKEDTDAIDEIEPQQGPVGPPVHSMSKLT